MSTKIDLKSLDLLQADSSWMNQALPDRLDMIERFRDFLDDMMRKDTKAWYRLSHSHIDEYKKLWGEPAFVFEGKRPYQTWIFKLAEGEHLVLYSNKESCTSFEYAGLPVPSDEAFEKATSILIAIRDTVHKPKHPEVEFGM